MSFKLSDEKKKELEHLIIPAGLVSEGEKVESVIRWVEKLLDAQYWAGFNFNRGPIKFTDLDGNEIAQEKPECYTVNAGQHYKLSEAGQWELVN